MKDPKPKAPRSPCPVSCALDLFGDRWTLIVVRDLLLGRTQFKDFEASPERIATNILSDRLSRLVAYGLAEKIPSLEVPGRFTYQLTEKGQSLGPIVQAIADWGLEHLEGTEVRLSAEGAEG